MNRKNMLQPVFVCVIVFTAMLFVPSITAAHCDTMNGPVVIAAQKALETNNVNLVLVWVQKKDEAAIKEAFGKTMAVRKLNPEAQSLADRFFFETLVRIHRAGEGVAFTGLKPAGAEVEPGIEAADRAIEKGNADDLLKDLNSEMEKGIRTQFARVIDKKNFARDDVDAGREYVEAYVVFIHYAERLFQAATAPAAGHFHEAERVGSIHQAE